VQALKERLANQPVAQGATSTDYKPDTFGDGARIHKTEGGSLITSPSSDGEVAVRNVEVTGAQRQGTASKLYLQAAKDAQASGAKILRSDPVSTEPSVDALWRKMALKGYDITESADPASGRPAFRWNLKGDIRPSVKPADWRGEIQKPSFIEHMATRPVEHDITDEWN
jgi:hypothetical protein